MTPTSSTPSNVTDLETQGTPESLTMENYRTPMLLPGMPGAPLFDGNDITDFLERFDDMCMEYKIGVEQKVRKLPRYCEVVIGRYIKTIPAYSSGDWEALAKALKRRYKHSDSIQQLYTRTFLENLKSTKRTKNDDLRT